MKNLLAILTLFCATFAAPAQTYRAVAVDTNGVLVAPANFVATNNLITVIGTPADTQVVAWDAAQTNHVYTSAGSGTLTSLTVSGGLLTGGGTSGVVNVSLATNEVLAATAAAYLSADEGVIIASGDVTIPDGGSLGFYAANEVDLAAIFLDGNDLIYSDTNEVDHTIYHTGNLPDPPNHVITLTVQDFTGPLASETLGWSSVDFDNAELTTTFEMLTTASSTQAGGTMRATVWVPGDVTGWADPGVRALYYGTTETTTDAKYDFSIRQMTSNFATASTNLYSVTNQTYPSAPEVLSVAAASLGTPTPGRYITLTWKTYARANEAGGFSNVTLEFTR
jgi:hypothetical protein